MFAKWLAQLPVPRKLSITGVTITYYHVPDRTFDALLMLLRCVYLFHLRPSDPALVFDR